MGEPIALRVDEAQGLVYFDAAHASHRQPTSSNRAQRRRDYAGFRQLREAPRHFQSLVLAILDVWSDAVTPTQVRLHRVDGTEVRVIMPRRRIVIPVPLSRPEFVEVRHETACDGRDADQAARFQSIAPLSRLPADLRRPTSAYVRNQWGGATYSITSCSRSMV